MSKHFPPEDAAPRICRFAGISCFVERGRLRGVKAAVTTAISVAIAIAASSLTFGVALLTGADTDVRLRQAGFWVPTIQTEAELRQLIGPEAGEVVRDAIGHFPNIVGLEPRLVSVLEEQLPAAWLPSLKGVWFQRFSMKWEGWTVECTRALWLEVSRDGDRLDVTVKEGNQCRRTGTTVTFTRDGQRWTKKTGLGSGMVGGTTHCPCS